MVERRSIIQSLTLTLTLTLPLTLPLTLSYRVTASVERRSMSAGTRRAVLARGRVGGN